MAACSIGMVYVVLPVVVLSVLQVKSISQSQMAPTGIVYSTCSGLQFNRKEEHEEKEHTCEQQGMSCAQEARVASTNRFCLRLFQCRLKHGGDAFGVRR